ncbi:zinc-dependent alcohol dehydrogenase [Amorphus orientalis]|uniref:(R,R)-butanediol dehydrogenase/meso-butanediol dehydrogenase/diacetyl reductase n=1 Tax=Amorphus orientalis TaxID=649198 RepID=A0AAE4ASC7_9HYPH|nr:alcohol dehydrogenase catalytic domain-containing protein [Amorphus orientalis]MDQ0314982.1 (R,R)-butanediol dehydrogenase/meso-butanediol dehydrogenase/diacetyl reductase [Amorphus orientalis]
MKAAIFDAFGKPLVIGERPDPSPSPDEVVLRICRCGICGSDLHMTEDATFGLQGGEVIGHEFSGEVMEVGRNVSDIKPGDLVAAAPLKGCGRCAPCRAGEPAWCEQQMELIGGGYAEYAALTARQVRRLPADVSLADGALAEPLAVALHGLRRARVAPGERVVVVGAGAIGLAVVFWARRLGAGAVVAVDLHDHQRDRAGELGATDFVTSGPEMRERIEKACGGLPDVVFECVGKVGLIDHCIDLVRPRGRVCVLGLCTGVDRLDSFRAISKEVDVIMSVFFDMNEFAMSIEALDVGRYCPQTLVSDVVELSDAPEAFEALRQRTTQCKVLIAP